MNEHLRHAQKLELLGTLASGIAHDFNNILTIVLAHADMAEMSADEPERVRESAREIRNACDRARNLTRQILTFSRKQRSELKPVQLQTIVKEVFGLLRSTLPLSIKMDLHLDTAAPVVLADATQIHQVLLNLATNARHAMGDTGGTLALRVNSCVQNEVTSPARDALPPGWYARLSITDTGHGMTPDVQKRIFEPFFTTKPPGEGTGLGLAVVQRIMKEHSGLTIVRSEPNSGTTFDLYFPARFENAPGLPEDPDRCQHATPESSTSVDADSVDSSNPLQGSGIREIDWEEESVREIPIRIVSRQQFLWNGVTPA